MSEIKTFHFNEQGLGEIRKYKYGEDWPVVYIIEDGKEMYVGESVRGWGRAKEHFVTEKRRKLNRLHIVADDEYNMSATKDTESSLIEYMIADGQFLLQNSNKGLQNHSFFDREKYQGKFEVIWKKLQQMKLAKSDLLQLRNSDLFKYSPYKTLTDDQYLIATQILDSIQSGTHKTYLIQGGPGTGKTILATYLIKRLVEEGVTDVALVIAMTSLRATLKRVFRKIPGLKPKMVIGPAEVSKKKYSVLVVDEAHRLRQRKGITNYRSHDLMNKTLGLDNSGNELHWVAAHSDKLVLFFDERQSVKPSDIPARAVHDLNPIKFVLETQKRVKGGEEYISFIDTLLEVSGVKEYSFHNYDFKIYEDLSQMVGDIRKRESEYSLARLVAGFAWPWVSQENPGLPDMVIGNTKLFWNSTTLDWVNSKNSVNEVGCIHTIQGYDLNYAGVIIGSEISYDTSSKKIYTKKEHYHDPKGHFADTTDEELKRYIVNIYKTLLTRGILGTYVYIVDDNLREYFKSSIASSLEKKVVPGHPVAIKSPYSETIKVPLFETVGCGELMIADSTVKEMVQVDKALISSGSKYFVLRTSGDSMNMVGINDGDLVLCRKNYHPEEGNIVVALIGDDATIKKFHRERDAVVLLPCSTNPKHQPLRFTDNEEMSVQGVVVSVLKDI